MKTNQLRIEPHIVKPDTEREYFAPVEGFVLWKIWIDDELLTETARPFQSNDSILELKTYIQIPVWADGAWYVSVRRMGEYMIWYSNLEFDKYYYTSWDNPNTIFVFDVHQYEDDCNKAIKETASLELKPPNLDSKSHQSTQSLNDRELRFLLNLNCPEAHVAIYREPSNMRDKTGTFLLRQMQHAIQAIIKFTVCDPPDKQIELRIGLDEKEFSEAIWYIGKVNDKCSIYFQQRPYFPVWLQSDVFDKILMNEPFMRDL